LRKSDGSSTCSTLRNWSDQFTKLFPVIGPPLSAARLFCPNRSANCRKRSALPAPPPLAACSPPFCPPCCWPFSPGWPELFCCPGELLFACCCSPPRAPRCPLFPAVVCCCPR